MTQYRTDARPTPEAEHWMAVTRQVQALAVKAQRILGAKDTAPPQGD